MPGREGEQPGRARGARGKRWPGRAEPRQARSLCSAAAAGEVRAQLGLGSCSHKLFRLFLGFFGFLLEFLYLGNV